MMEKVNLHTHTRHTHTPARTDEAAAEPWIFVPPELLQVRKGRIQELC